MKKRSIFLIGMVLLLPLNALVSFGGDISNAATAIHEQFAGIEPFDLDSPLQQTPASDNVLSDYLHAFSGISQDALKYAMAGYAQLLEQGKLLKKDIITIVDFSKPSTEERLFVIDLKNKQILMKSLCAHGRNSGEVWAESFSNTAQSFKSSLGFYIANETYEGAHGYSLRLDGQESGINDKARDRGVVMHAADYVSKAFIQATGRLGRSEGCPALPTDKYEKIISLIKGGSCLFIYHPDKQYLSHSALLKHYNESLLSDLLCSINQ